MTWKSELAAMEQRKLCVKEQHFCLTDEMTGQELVNVSKLNNDVKLIVCDINILLCTLTHSEEGQASTQLR